MTVSFREGESWSVDDGAPEGVAFDYLIPSSDHSRDYRIARQEHRPPALTGYLVHTPACPAWRRGNRMCSHVLRAIERAEQPLRRFALDVLEAWPLVCLSPEAKQEMAGAMYQEAQAAINQAQALEEYAERREVLAAFLALPKRDREDEDRRRADEAIAEFDRGPRGAAR